MANAKITFYRVTLFACLLVYTVHWFFVFYLYDYQGVKPMVNQRLERLGAVHEAVDALVIGGSNVLFGVSAETLSEKTPYTFHNLGLVSEGYSQDNYMEFISSASRIVNDNQIRLVVWSSYKVFREPSLERSGLTVYGAPKPALVPPQTIKSTLSRLWDRTDSQHYYAITGAFGDFDFSRYKCGPYHSTNPSLASFTPLMEYYRRGVFTLRELFPSARILIVIPSLYQMPLIPDDYVSMLRQELAHDGVDLLIENPIMDLGLICEVEHHPNEMGREFRSRGLAEALLAAPYN